MYNHEPHDYNCPFCNLLQGIESEHNQKADIVYQNTLVTASIAPKWWVNNHGSVLVIPNEHFENIYDIPDAVIAEIYKTVKLISMAIRSTYEGCEGTSTRQHNEPTGDQDVWHFHTHVFPRYPSDNLYLNNDNAAFHPPEARLPYAEKLRNYLHV